MGKALMVFRNFSSAFVNAQEVNLFGAGSNTSLEANAQASSTEAATFSNLRGNITAGGSGTNTLQFRKNGANGSQTCNRVGTGILEDTTNTDVLAANDLFNLAYTDTGTDSTFGWVSGNVEFSSGHGNFHGAANFNSAVYDVENSTRFMQLGGTQIADAEASETPVQWKSRGYTSFEALQVRVIANARTNTSTFKNRINGSDGGFQIDFGAGVTGLIVDTTTPDVLVDGDLINASVTLGSGLEDLSVSFISCTLKSSTNKSEIWAAVAGGQARAASSTATYFPIGGGINPASGLTEANARVKVGFAASVSNLRCYLSANTYTGDGTLKLIQNGTAVMTTTLTASGGAAWYENTADTITIDDDDELSFEIDEGTSGSISIYSIGITFSALTGNISSSGESVATLSGASTAEAPITSAGESVATLTGTSVAEAPITSAGESSAIFEGESDVPSEGRISIHAESIATLSGAAIFSSDISLVGESTATLEGGSLVDGAIVDSAGKALLTVFGVGVSGAEADDGPSWYHGTSKEALKNPWKKKRRKGPDDDEFMALFNYALSVTKSRPPQ